MDVADSILAKIGEAVKTEAQRNLGTTRNRFSIKAKWKNGRPISYTKSRKKGRSDSTGNLRKSIKWNVKDGVLSWEMDGYGEFVEEGRKGKKLNTQNIIKGGFIPVSELRKWMRQKPIRASAAGGGFIKQDKKTMESLSFMINRKIKWFGIDATRFFSEAFYKHTKDLQEQLGQAIGINK